jgi:hypothetical protein
MRRRKIGENSVSGKMMFLKLVEVEERPEKVRSRQT